jgi:S1-C subfamily serine protease
MTNRQMSLRCAAGALLGWLSQIVPTPSYAQLAGQTVSGQTVKTEAPLVVDGTVRQVFTSTRQGVNEYLLELEVQRSEGRGSTARWARARFPGPGESVYVHVGSQADPTGVRALKDGRGLPEEGKQVRAYLTPREKGGWEPATLNWFESPGGLSSGPAAATTTRPSLGMTTDPLKVENRTVLRVTSVERGGAAQESGLEVGDIIAGVDGSEITGAEQLDAAAAQGKKFSLVVIDVNTGRAARVAIDPNRRSTSAETPGSTSTAEAPKVSLGISAEPVILGTRSALKVTRVDPAGPAAKAGLEPGDHVVAANGVPTTGVEQLLGALRKSGPTLNLTVRDARTGRDTEVAVALSGTKTATPTETDSSIAKSSGRLGAVTELAFHDSDFAVKVTEIESGSAAARAGLRPGLLIVSADGKAVLHPNDLNDAIRNSRGTLNLTVVDPTNGRKSNVAVTLSK